MTTISVCTLARGRARQLENLVAGLRQSERPPRELIVAVMQRRRYKLPEASFPIRQVMVTDAASGEAELCLARGRNAAARAASGDLLVFLDADCIPGPWLLDDYAAAAATHAGVLIGDVGYLAKGDSDHGVDFARFAATAVRHPERPEQREAVAACEGLPPIWSLNFAITRREFCAVGGFDERYVGYGGEDADFLRTVRERNALVWWLRGATAFHQFHPHHVPPVHHVDAVVANARRYEEKWREPAMEQWLRAFTLMGLVRRDREGWRKLRDPGEADFAVTRQQELLPCASGAQVLRWLEDRAVRRIDGRPGGPGNASTVAA